MNERNQKQPIDTPAKIGIYDSGVGGLSIAASIREAIPSLAMVYCSDNKNFPYGTKSEEDVVAFTVDHATRLWREYQIDLLVIACNTASTVALETLRQTLPIPVVGVVPAIKPAAVASQSKHIGLLATPGTVQRSYTKKLIDDFAADCTVTMHGTSVLVHMAEQKLRGHDLDLSAVKDEVAPLFLKQEGKADLDTVVLGCTHFPLLAKELRMSFPDLQWIDSGPAIAARVKHLLMEAGWSLDGRVSEGGGSAVFTKNDPAVFRLQEALERFGFPHIRFLD